jgi:hypothetical protein
MPRHFRIAAGAFQVALPVAQRRRDAGTPDVRGQMAPPVDVVPGAHCIPAIPSEPRPQRIGRPGRLAFARCAMVLCGTLLLCLTDAPMAQVFKCNRDGATVFQDRPCEGVAAPAKHGAAAAGNAAADVVSKPGREVPRSGSTTSQGASPGAGPGAGSGHDAEARMTAMALQAFEALRAGDVSAYMRLGCPRKDNPGRSPAESQRLQMDFEEVARREAQAWVGEIRLQGLTAGSERGGTGDWLVIRLEAARPMPNRNRTGWPQMSVHFDRDDGRLCIVRFTL